MLASMWRQSTRFRATLLALQSSWRDAKLIQAYPSRNYREIGAILAKWKIRVLSKLSKSWIHLDKSKSWVMKSEVLIRLRQPDRQWKMASNQNIYLDWRPAAIDCHIIRCCPATNMSKDIHSAFPITWIILEFYRRMENFSSEKISPRLSLNFHPNTSRKLRVLRIRPEQRC